MRARDALWRTAMRVAYQGQLAWWAIRHPVLTGAAVAVWHDGRILLIRNSYRRRYGFPCGGVHRRETPLRAALRELAEEAGVRARPEELAYHGEIVTDGLAEDHVHFFELACTDEPPLRVDGREVVWAGFVAPEEALELGVVPPVRRYLESRAAATASSKDTSSRSMRR